MLYSVIVIFVINETSNKNIFVMKWNQYLTLRRTHIAFFRCCVANKLTLIFNLRRKIFDVALF